ncbi:sarcosine oxidase subunit gamma [Shimia sp.]|uniref:sarcosine oxidase subunit gamma n=1 Tax=Shimia sp. TaxID=1954381 RepID=UPI003BA8D321
MIELKAKTACEGLLPKRVGDMRIEEAETGHITLIAPLDGQAAAVDEALMETHKLSFPKPNRSTGRAGERLIWSGCGQAFLMGPALAADLSGLAAVTDQSDAWAVVRLEGEQGADVLARLVPVDLRPQSFKRGHTVRTLLGHMTVSITRMGDSSFQIMAFRSMAKTLVHELITAMESLGARG